MAFVISFENWVWGWRDMPPFSSSVGERKLMTHFVVTISFVKCCIRDD
jgi:hypothetical protein